MTLPAGSTASDACEPRTVGAVGPTAGAIVENDALHWTDKPVAGSAVPPSAGLARVLSMPWSFDPAIEAGDCPASSPSPESPGGLGDCPFRLEPVDVPTRAPSEHPPHTANAKTAVRAAGRAGRGRRSRMGRSGNVAQQRRAGESAYTPRRGDLAGSGSPRAAAVTELVAGLAHPGGDRRVRPVDGGVVGVGAKADALARHGRVLGHRAEELSSGLQVANARRTVEVPGWRAPRQKGDRYILDELVLLALLKRRGRGEHRYAGLG